ncbi:MAG: hypothetical protein IJ060_03240 [Oscillospiraceae bacterium]|nr:hypothetical protein [Oscillospiraceae bacterium]
MASIYTDAEREARYAKLRTKKRAYDKIFDFCMLGAIVFGVFALRDILLVFFAALWALSIPHILVCLLAMACVLGTVWAIYKKDVRFTFCVLLLMLFLTFTGTAPVGVPLILIAGVTCVTDFLWYQLSQEEGFPQFEIGFEEWKQREKAYEHYAENRAVEAGVRAAADAGDDGGEMHDLLDEKLTPLPAAPARYKSRFEQAHVYEKQNRYQPGVMDDLEDLLPSEGSDDDDILKPM